MAVCELCKREMTKNVSCIGDSLSGPRHDGPGNCHDCGTPPGGIHHPGCDDERCPECGGQMIGHHREGCKIAAKIEEG